MSFSVLAHIISGVVNVSIEADKYILFDVTMQVFGWTKVSRDDDVCR